MKANLIVVSCLLVGGCASAGSDCAADAYALGQRDGVLGAQMQQTGARCGAQFDQARYAEGWRAGFSSRPIPLW
jgi:hypothetical protein